MAKLTNVDILERYQKKHERAKRQLERTLRGIITAANRMVRAKNLVAYLERQIAAVLLACDSGLPFRPERVRKPKPGRLIEL